jgi:hypothetical protein
VSLVELLTFEMAELRVGFGVDDFAPNSRFILMEI